MVQALLKVFSIRFAGSGAGFAIALMLLAFLDPVALGIFYVVDSTALLMALLVSFSVPASILPLRRTVLGDARAGRDLDRTLFLVTLAQTLGVLVVAAIAVAVLTGGRFEGAWPYALLLAPIAVLRLFLFDHHRAEERFTLAALLEDRKGRNVLFMIVLAGLLLLGGPEETRLETALAGLSLAAALPVLAGLVAARPVAVLRGTRPAHLKAPLRAVGRMGLKLAGYSVMVRSFPPMVLSLTGFVGGAPAAATLGLVYSLAGAAEMATGAARVTLVKGVNRLNDGDHAAFNRALVISILFAVTGVVGAIALLGAVGLPVLRRFYDMAALPAFETTLAVMLLVALVKAATTFQEVVLKNMGDVRSLSWAYACGIVLATGVSLALLADWGAPAAAAGHLILFSLVGAWNWAYVARHYAAPRFSKALLRGLAGQAAARLRR